MDARKTARMVTMKMQTENKNILITIYLIAMVSIGWGLSFPFLALLLKVMAPAQMLAVRWSYMAIMFLLLILTGKVRLDLKGKNVLFLLLPGLCEPCAYSILEAYGIKLTSASVSAIFVATVPCMTLVLGILFFHKKGDRKLVTGIIAAFLGVTIATVFSPAFSLGGTRIGAVLMTLAVIAASLYALTSSRAGEDFDALSITAVMTFEGALFFDILCFFQGYGPGTFLLPFHDAKTLFCVLFLVIFCAYASYVCYNRLVSLIDPALATNMTGSLSTVIGVVAGILLAGDSWGWYTVVGMLITLVGVWLSGMRMKEDL